jgi:hypothetical protein
MNGDGTAMTGISTEKKIDSVAGIRLYDFSLATTAPFSEECTE